MLNPLSSIEAWIVVLGIIIVGIGIAYGLSRSRKTTPREDATRDAATHQLYKEEDKGKLP